MAPNAEEGRGTLRKATGSCVQALNRRCPNGETHTGEPCISCIESIDTEKGTWGTETSKYPEEKRSFRE